LLNKFDAVCPQGSYEYDRAKNYFNIEKARLFPLGSTWFRHLDLLKGQMQSFQLLVEEQKKCIIYAGNSPSYFSRINEFAAIDALLEKKIFFSEDLKLVYRPVVTDAASKAEITEKYGQIDDIELQWPEASSIGLTEYHDVDQNVSLKRYVSDLSRCELLIMSLFTSMALDAVYLTGCPVISSFIDLDGYLEKQRADLLEVDALPGLKVASSVDDLLQMVETALMNKEKFRDEAKSIKQVWDFPEVNFEGKLLKAVFDIEY
jgi:hypothetical protein